MFPTPSRVKLNRVAFKDVIGMKKVLRRRVPTSLKNDTTDSQKQEIPVLLLGPESVKDSSSSQPVQIVIADPENVAGRIHESDLRKKYIGPQRAKRKWELQQDEPNSRDIDTCPNHTGLESEGSLRRAVKPAGCGPCGDCKYVSPQRKTLGKQGQSSSNPGSEKSTFEVKFKDKITATEASQKIFESIDQYPMVTLCDVSQKCDAFWQDSVYMLPDDLKNKVVHCFKQEMKAGFEFRSDYSGPNKHERVEGSLAGNGEFCPMLQSERGVCPSQSLTEQQRHPKEHPDAQKLSSHTTCCNHNRMTSESSATSSGSLLIGERERKECRNAMWGKDVEGDPGTGYPLIRVEIFTEKREKLGDGVKNDILPVTSDLKFVNCRTPTKTDTRDKERTCSWMSDDQHSCSELAEGASKCDSVVKENSIYQNNYNETDSHAASSEPFCQGNVLDTEELESFTCQRVRIYFRKTNVSCARTYISWPFSNSGLTITAHASTTASAIEPKHLSGKNNVSTIKHSQMVIPSNKTNGMLHNAPKDLPLFKGCSNQVSNQNDEKQEDCGESILAERNEKSYLKRSSVCPVKTNLILHQLMTAEEPLLGHHSNMINYSNSSQCGREPPIDARSGSSFPLHRSEIDSSMSTAFSSTDDLSASETVSTLSSITSPCTHGGLSILSATPPSLPLSSILLGKFKDVELADASSPNLLVKSVEKKSPYCEETQNTSNNSPHSSDSCHTCDSYLLLPQDKQECDEEILKGRCKEKMDGYNAEPINNDLLKERMFLTGTCVETDFILPPMLSPLTSPQRPSQTNFLSHKKGSSDGLEDEDDEEINNGTLRQKILSACHMRQFNINKEGSKDLIENGLEGFEEVSIHFNPLKSLRERQCPSTEKDVEEEESQNETDCEDDEEREAKKSPFCNEIMATLTSDVQSEPGSFDGSEEDGDAFIEEEQPCSSRTNGTSPSEMTRIESKAETIDDTQQGILDELTAYEQDILLVDMDQEDQELFENLPLQSILKLGPSRVPKTRPRGLVKILAPSIDRTSPKFEQSANPVHIDFSCDSPEIPEDSGDRPWRPHCSITQLHPKAQSSTFPATETQTTYMNKLDSNNNHVKEILERSKPSYTKNFLPTQVTPNKNIRKGPWITNPVNVAEFRRQKSNSYCRQYFSETLSCGFKVCRFRHVPVEGDEKFCIEIVTRFTKNPMCLQKAGAVFAGYYQNNPPGVYFSKPALLSLLWSLLKAGMVSDVFSVLSVSLAHKIVPGHEFLLALFNSVRERGLTSLVPELMQLTFKMANAGLVLSLDCLDCVKNTSEVHQEVSGKLSTSAPSPEYLNLAHAVVEIELCSKQEDWKRMGEVFRSICQSRQHPNLVEQISGRIAIALLSESKDKLSLPFVAFAETVCQNEGEVGLIESFFGRIGVSLMLRYHKTHQWAKGRKVVQVLSISKVSYSTLKGLFGNEDQASRCYLITVATELFLLNGSVEGALHTLRENKWFLSSCSWPCVLSDMESRTRVLMRLAEKTSHRDALEVLCNLPGLKEPTDLINISRYCHLFNAHLRVCVDRQTLPVASDTVDFMLSKNLAVDHALLQMLLHKLGKQNLWLRAREVFRHSLSMGYFSGVSAPPGFMTLMVPSQLGEVELALAFEMFITVNAAAIHHLSETTTGFLSITLKRTHNCEREYLSASSRLLSAAGIPQPKLIIHYKAVNSSQEQVFTIDTSSARCWLRHNHLWANEVWAH